MKLLKKELGLMCLAINHSAKLSEAEVFETILDIAILYDKQPSDIHKAIADYDTETARIINEALKEMF